MSWQAGCWICCALVLTSPIGGRLCRSWSRREGLEEARCARLGALCWAAGFMPWLYLVMQIKGGVLPRGLMAVIYTVLFIAWFMGPVVVGFVMILEFPEFSDRRWLVVHPIASLLAWVVALLCLWSAKVLPAGSQRVERYRVVPSVLGSLSMLSWLPYFLANNFF